MPSPPRRGQWLAASGRVRRRTRRPRRASSDPDAARDRRRRAPRFGRACAGPRRVRAASRRQSRPSDRRHNRPSPRPAIRPRTWRCGWRHRRRQLAPTRDADRARVPVLHVMPDAAVMHDVIQRNRAIVRSGEPPLDFLVAATRRSATRRSRRRRQDRTAPASGRTGNRGAAPHRGCASGSAHSESAHPATSRDRDSAAMSRKRCHVRAKRGRYSPGVGRSDAIRASISAHVRAPRRRTCVIERGMRLVQRARRRRRAASRAACHTSDRASAAASAARHRRRTGRRPGGAVGAATPQTIGTRRACRLQRAARRRDASPARHHSPAATPADCGRRGSPPLRTRAARARAIRPDWIRASAAPRPRNARNRREPRGGGGEPLVDRRERPRDERDDAEDRLAGPQRRVAPIEVRALMLGDLDLQTPVREREIRVVREPPHLAHPPRVPRIEIVADAPAFRRSRTAALLATSREARHRTSWMPVNVAVTGRARVERREEAVERRLRGHASGNEIH